MPDISSIIQAGAANPWLYLPAALLLGALHALEPGHSKSLMAAFIIAVRGTPRQAVLLGVSAAAGHTLVVWIIALIGLYLGNQYVLKQAEPWLQLISGVLIVLLALRLLWTLRRKFSGASVHHHGHDHGDHHHDHEHDHDHHDHDHDDAHAAAHARDLETKFGGRHHVTTGEIVWFGFTGGLLPCPAAIAVLLICLQLRQLTLGIAMVAAFSVGLALTMVAVGVAAAWSAHHAIGRWPSLDRWAGRLPYFSGAVVMMLGLFIMARGLYELGAFPKV